MTELILSILASTCLLFIFKLFPRFKVDTDQAVVFNYFTAFITGSIVNSAFPSPKLITHDHVWGWIFIAGLLFISLFLAMGYSSVKNGVGVTSVVVKMSMAMTMLLFVAIYSESLTLLKIVGFLLAIAGVLLMSLSSGGKSGAKSSLFLLPLLFFGSSMLDLVLKVAQDKLHLLSASAFSASGFLAAGLIGLCYMLVTVLAGNRKIRLRNVFGGIVLGIPNYFSIYLLIQSYKTTGWNASTTLAVTAIAIVSLSTIFGIVLFNESASRRKFVGLTTSVLAIVLLAFFSES